jgi:hypothetical protein
MKHTLSGSKKYERRVEQKTVYEVEMARDAAIHKRIHELFFRIPPTSWKYKKEDK